MHGFDLAWRDAVRLHLGWAGVRGRFWLMADACMQSDFLRVRVGPLVGELVNLEGVGIGQGRRAAVQLFGVLVRALIDNVQASTIGVGVDAPTAALCAVESAGGMAVHGDVQWSSILDAVGGAKAGTKDLVTAVVSLRSGAERSVFLDAMSGHGMLMLQFVDDSFVLQSSLWGLTSVNKALSAFCVTWRHRFKMGTKGPAVLCIGGADSQRFSCGTVDGTPPALTDKMLVLGVWLDDRLQLHEQLDVVCGKLLEGTKSLVRRLNDLGFGVPFQVYQFGLRVCPSAFYGAEVLASFGPGWRKAAKRLNDTHYAIAKVLLGLPAGESLGEGGYVRAFSETRFLTRLGGELAQRIVLARARLLLLPPGSPVEAALLGAAQVSGQCWLRDAEGVMVDLGMKRISAQIGGTLIARAPK